MDSQLAADPIIKKILETLVTLEKAAGVRAHYRILDPPPLSNTDEHNLQTVARVLGDWMGLRNAMFDIKLVDHQDPPRLFRTDPDREEFEMEIPSRALASPETAIAAITRQVARAYLINSNIAASSVDVERTSGSMADITTIFLGMGKLILNSPAAGQVMPGHTTAGGAENLPLSPDYLAFAHRLVCSMRGLDWAQHAGGLSKQAIENLRKWDVYRDSVFNQALRNVLTASASHRPLMDAIEDNQLALARFDQILRTIVDTSIKPLQQELEGYHITCREGTEKLTVREQDTYDPCLLYLNQLRRRMDLQRYADVLHIQQNSIINRLRVVNSALGDLNARKLVQVTESPEKQITVCPFDGTPVTIDVTGHDSRVKCHNCGYTFLASPGYTAVRPSTSDATMEPDGSDSGLQQMTDKQSGDKASSAGKSKEQPGTGRTRKATPMLVAGIALLPLSWLPMICYALVTSFLRQPAPLVPLLGQVGMWGSGLAVIVLLVGLVILLRNILSGDKTAPGRTPKAGVKAP